MKLKSLLLSTTLLCFAGSAFAQLSFNDNIVSHWKLDETSGTTVADDITGATGTLIGEGVGYVDGVFGGAIDFTNFTTGDIAGIVVKDDGSNLTPINFTSESFTISLWTIVDPTLGEQTQIIKGTNGADALDFDGIAVNNANGHRFTIQTKDSELRFAVDDALNKTQLGVNIDTLAIPYPTGEWVNIVGVRDRDAAMLYLYLNGDQIGSITDATGDLNIAGQDLVLSNYVTGANVTMGPLDDVIIINKALSETEVIELFEYDTPVGIAEKTVSGSTVSSADGAIIVNVDSPAAVTVYSIDGKVVASQTVEETASIPSKAGIYVIIIDGEAIKVMVK